MEGSYHNNSQNGHPAAPGMMGYGAQQQYQDGNEMDGKRFQNLYSKGMYEGDPYGDELEGG